METRISKDIIRQAMPSPPSPEAMGQCLQQVHPSARKKRVKLVRLDEIEGLLATDSKNPNLLSIHANNKTFIQPINQDFTYLMEAVACKGCAHLANINIVSAFLLTFLLY